MALWLRYFAFMVVIWTGTGVTMGIVRIYREYRDGFISLFSASEQVLTAPITFVVLSIFAFIVIRFTRAVRLPFIVQLGSVAVTTILVVFFVFVFDWLVTANDNFSPNRPHDIKVFFDYYADEWQYQLSDGFLNLVQYACFVLYLSLHNGSVLWAKADGDERGKTGCLVGLLVAFLQFPIGLLVWLVFRPKKEPAAPPIQSLPA